MCSQPWLCHSTAPNQSLSAPSSCFASKLPVCLLLHLSVSPPVRISVCGTVLLYDPVHFPLTFHFLHSHPVSGTTVLCTSVLFHCALTGYSSPVQFITLKCSSIAVTMLSLVCGNVCSCNDIDSPQKSFKLVLL